MSVCVYDHIMPSIPIPRYPLIGSPTGWSSQLVLAFYRGFQLANLRVSMDEVESRILPDSAATMHHLMDHGRNGQKKHSPRSGSFAVFNNMVTLVTINFSYLVCRGNLIDLKPHMKILNSKSRI